MALIRRVALGVLLLFVPAARADAQPSDERIVRNPLLLNAVGKVDTAPEMLLVGPSGTPHKTSLETHLNLNIVYTDARLWNPAANRYDAVRLRSYQGDQVNPNAPFVSPTIEVMPGETVRVSLNNKLPADASCAGTHAHGNTPHCFNGTNLHAHGLWVNPAGNGDNVLISINPGVSFQYEYKIPPDHPAGTFWYHTHRHGSTALQVSSGMAGALIVHGQRLPSPSTAGDIDTLLRGTTGQPLTERVVVMQQIQYACRDVAGKIKVDPANGKAYRCDAGDVGTVEGYDQFGPSSWRDSGRYTSINGQILPTFDGARTGSIERWRLIHAGVRDTISLQFRERIAAAPTPAAMTAAETDAYVGANCTGAPIAQYLIAADGITTGAAITSDTTTFQPGYRWDALMMFPHTGTYCVINAAAPAAGVGQQAPARQLLGFVTVGPGNSSSGIESALVAAATRNMPAKVRDKVISDLRDGLRFSSFVPHEDIATSEVTGKQELVFNIDVTQQPLQFQIDGKAYDSARVDRVLTLGSVDEWTLRSDLASHPFHIHVNPFQVVKILDPTGKDVSEPDAQDTFGSASGIADPQYRALKGVWKDTLWVKNVVPAGQPPGRYVVVIRSRYRRYIGDFVLHCHILDHEDQGMMQYVRIALPNGSVQ